jgi:hypothetical protein
MTDEIWLYYEKLDNWHLQLAEVTTSSDEEEEPVITYESWCKLTFDKDAPRKERSALSQWGDALHDECLRKAGT